MFEGLREMPDSNLMVCLGTVFLNREVLREGCGEVTVEVLKEHYSQFGKSEEIQRR
jgi:hypothetical protein